MSNPTYYDGDLRHDLLTAAVRSIEQNGPAGVSLRSLARSIGVSHAAPKNHFATKTELFAAVALQGFEALNAGLSAATGDNQLLELGMAYVEHALAHPAHVQVMWQSSLHGKSARVEAAGQSAFEILVSVVARSESDQQSAEANVATAERMWAVAHGFSTLLNSGALQPPVGEAVVTYVRHQLRDLWPPLRANTD